MVEFRQWPFAGHVSMSRAGPCATKMDTTRISAVQSAPSSAPPMRPMRCQIEPRFQCPAWLKMIGWPLKKKPQGGGDISLLAQESQFYGT